MVSLKGSGVGAHGTHEGTGHQGGADMKFASEIWTRVVLVVVSRVTTLGGWGVLLVLIHGEDVELALLVLAGSMGRHDDGDDLLF